MQLTKIMKCVTWNVSFLKASHSAPRSRCRPLITIDVDDEDPHTLDSDFPQTPPRRTWTTLDSETRIQALILAHNPDVIALQESPYEKWGTEIFGPYGYFSVGTVQSHCYFVDLMVKNNISNNSNFNSNSNSNSNREESNADVTRILTRTALPCVAARVKLQGGDCDGNGDGNGKEICFASCHLEPFGDKADKAKRLEQMSNIIESLFDHTDNYIILGDMNMRQDEDKRVKGLVNGHGHEHGHGHGRPGLLHDAWEEKGTKNNKFTWNSRDNKFHEGGFAYTTRYDRAYCHGDDLEVQSFGLVGNQPLVDEEGGGKHHFLSDHYGIVADFGIRIGGEQKLKSSSPKKKRARTKGNGDD